jgi:hypothetical protein
MSKEFARGFRRQGDIADRVEVAREWFEWSHWAFQVGEHRGMQREVVVEQGGPWAIADDALADSEECRPKVKPQPSGGGGGAVSEMVANCGREQGVCRRERATGVEELSAEVRGGKNDGETDERDIKLRVISRGCERARQRSPKFHEEWCVDAALCGARRHK